MKPRILLIEDERKLAGTLQKGLQEAGYQVKLAFDGLEGISTFHDEKFSLVILDLNLPGTNGYEVCKAIRKEDHYVPVLLLTALGLTENKLAGFNAGADDYVEKPFEFRELVARVKALLRRGNLQWDDLMAPKELTATNLILDLDKKEARRGDEAIPLTLKEFQLLEYLLRNKNKVVSKEDIYKYAWEIEFHPKTNVVEVYVNFLRKKLDKDHSPKLIHTQFGSGYILREN